MVVRVKIEKKFNGMPSFVTFCITQNPAIHRAFVKSDNSRHFGSIIFFFQLAQKLREEHESASVVYIEDGNEEAGLRGDERELFEKFLKIENKQVRP
jgi:hypothetical protein